MLIIAAVTEPQKVRHCWFAAAQQPGHEEEQAPEHFELDAIEYCCLAAASSEDIVSSQYEVELLVSLKKTAHFQKDHWIRKKAKELQDGFKNWLIAALAGHASRAFRMLKEFHPIDDQPVQLPDGTWSLEPAHVMEARQLFWAAFWNKPEQRHRLGNLLTELKQNCNQQQRSCEVFSGVKMQESLKGYSNQKARGIDHWSVEEKDCTLRRLTP